MSSCSNRGLRGDDELCHCFYPFQGDDCSETLILTFEILLKITTSCGCIAIIVALGSIMFFFLTKSKTKSWFHRTKTMFFLLFWLSLINVIFITVDPFGTRLLIPYLVHDLLLSSLLPLSLLVFLMSVVMWAQTRLLYNGGIDTGDIRRQISLSLAFNGLFAFLSYMRAFLKWSLIFNGIGVEVLNAITFVSGAIPFSLEIFILLFVRYKATKQLSKDNAFYKRFQIMTRLLAFSGFSLSAQFTLHFLFLYQVPKSEAGFMISIALFSLSISSFSISTLLGIFGLRYNSNRSFFHTDSPQTSTNTPPPRSFGRSSSSSSLASFEFDSDTIPLSRCSTMSSTGTRYERGFEESTEYEED